MHYHHLSCEGSRHAIHVPHKLSPASRAHKRTCHHSQLALPYSSLARTTTCSCTRREIDQVRVWPCLEAARTHSSALVPGPGPKSPGLVDVRHVRQVREKWCMTGRSVGLSLLDQRRPACPDRAKVDQSRPVPLPKSSAPAVARDAWRRRSCDLSGLAHSETAQAVRVRIPVRVAVAVMHQSLGNASDPKTPPSGASAKLPPLTFHHAKIALVHVTESRVPMHQVLHDWGGRRS